MKESARCVCKMRAPVVMRRHGGNVTRYKRMVTFRTAGNKLVDIEVKTDRQLDKYQVGEDYILPT